MALSYANVFGDVGELIRAINSYRAIGVTTLPADLAALVAQFGGRWLPPEGIASAYEGFRDSVSSWRNSLGGYCDRRLLDHATVGAELNLPLGSGLQQVLPALRRQMVTDSQTVLKCTCAAGSVTAASGNAGNGTAYVTTVLDGYNPPAAGAQANVAYNGLTTEFCAPSETVTLECLADSVQGGLPEGAERFGLSGGAAYGGLDCRDEGSGVGPAVTVADAGGTLLSNGNLETWSSNVPSGWTLASGTAGTHMLQETGASNVYRGSSSAKFAGQGAGTIRLTQAVSPSLVQGKRRYFVGLAVKASATSAPATFRCCWSGTGYSEGSDKIEIAGGSLPTGWTRYGFFANFPAPLPSDWALKIETVDLEAAKSVYVDSVCAVPAVYHGGVGLAVVAGSSRWLKGDRLTFTLTNDQAGKFQRFFVRRWKTQLPSVAAANTIDEAWAT